MSLTQYKPSRLLAKFTDHIRPTINYQMDLFKSLQISFEDLGVIMGHLKHNPQKWGHINRDHHQFKKTFKDINELLPDLLLTDPKIVVHFEANWLLISENNVMIPAIFSLNQGCRDGLSVTLYRLVQGEACIWLKQAPEWINQAAVNIDANPAIERELTAPCVGLYLG